MGLKAVHERCVWSISDESELQAGHGASTDRRAVCRRHDSALRLHPQADRAARDTQPGPVRGA